MNKEENEFRTVLDTFYNTLEPLEEYIGKMVKEEVARIEIDLNKPENRKLLNEVFTGVHDILSHPPERKKIDIKGDAKAGKETFQQIATEIAAEHQNFRFFPQKEEQQTKENTSKKQPTVNQDNNNKGNFPTKLIVFGAFLLSAKVRGTQDILPTQALLYQQIQQITQNILNHAGYQPIILPTYEHRELFTTSVGETTDIVQKEMFTFSDRKGRQLVLRPEGTASTVRLVCQNKLVDPGYPLRLPETKEKYKTILKEYLKNKQICSDCQKRYQLNPLRILDCKTCHLDGLPSYKKVLTENDLVYLEELTKSLNNLEINHFYNEHLVRGLDYYTGMVFELLLNDEEQVVLGGGRYDQLFQQLGNVNLPAAGFALGVDRLVNYLSITDKKNCLKTDIFFLILEKAAHPLVLSWREKLSENYKTISNLEVKKVKNVFKNINYYSPRLAVIIGKKELKEKEVLIKDCQEKKEFVIKHEELVN
ncbi:8944_t:CDS:2 [Entrophospora sp. SA101]|nr:8944_t:CDS:2 [Entrophospora sp. SA101]CAJ0846321.1 4444_t:CDS:2 [Entrophospora sp. SA101]CAJ0913766.1 12908_t:CDS:2 [Entrophospora sp. SA101]